MMATRILGVVAGLVVWAAVATIAGLIMRAAWPEYAAVADAMTFTLPMMQARLAIGGLATLAAGWVTAGIVRRSILASVMPGLLLLIVFIPIHIGLWDKFPVWYHLTFLVSLVPLTWLGARLAAPWRDAGVRDRPAAIQAVQQASSGPSR
jgi:hypothetical protein